MSSAFQFMFDFLVDHWKVWLGLFVLQALLGIFLIELAYGMADRVVNGQQELYDQFPAYKRLSADRLKRSNLYPACIFVLIPKAAILFGSLGVIAVGIWIAHIGGAPKDEPLTGWRLTVLNWTYWIFTPLVLFGFSYRYKVIDYADEDVDYSKYLGPNYRQNKFKGKKVSTMICNHIGFLDELVWIICDSQLPSFTPADYVETLCIGNHYCRSLRCIYLKRGKDEASRDESVRRIIERQQLIETSDQNWPQLYVYAEGGVTNGTVLSRFRRGAFEGNFAVKPNVMSIQYKDINPDFSSLKGFSVGCMMVCSFAMQTVTAKRYPVFVPNDYLYKEYARTIPGYEKMERWEIYAHAVHDFMRVEGGLAENHQPLSEKVRMREFIAGKTNEIHVNGKTYYWPPRHDDPKKATQTQESPKEK